MPRTCLWIAFAGAAVLWALLLAGAALVAGGGESPMKLLAAGVYALGSIVCHQQPARSFVMAGAQLPVCARCTGIYMGAALTVFAVLVAGPSGVVSPFAHDGSTRRWRWLLAAAVAPSLATLIYEWSTGVAPGNITRAFAGAPMGIVVCALVWATLGGSRGASGDQVH